MKKGFTLIEMLAVIVILAIVSLIIFPEVNKNIKNSKEKAYNTQINNLINATKEMVVRDTTILPPAGSDIVKCVTFTALKNAGKIPSDIIYDPRDSKVQLTGYITIRYSAEYSQPIYEYSENCPSGLIY